MRPLVLVGLLAACGSLGESKPDAPGGGDAAPDAPADAATSVPLAGFGDLGGMCGALNDAELTGTSPSIIHATLMFSRRYNDPADRPLLTTGGARMMTTPNAGGSSGMSEAFAYEQLARCELAPLLKTETEIVYDTLGKITDLMVSIDGHKLGVSVTRAVAYPFGQPYTLSSATTLLMRKLEDIQLSTANVSAADRWEKQVLAYMSWDDQSTAMLDQAWASIDPSIKADTILIITTTHGDDQFLYSNN
ncbi:MAG: hypothetical protein H0T42_04640 [Deltaproteobacteria bacterium]|nr:hypothetical protein [Deltaproteobacteria bacterium]